MILKGTKACFTQAEIRQVTVPFYQELSVKNLFEALSEDYEVLSYLPDSGKRTNDRNFMWSIVNTLRPDFVK